MHAVKIYLLISESKKRLFELTKTIHFVLNFARQKLNIPSGVQQPIFIKDGNLS